MHNRVLHPSMPMRVAGFGCVASPDCMYVRMHHINLLCMWEALGVWHAPVCVCASCCVHARLFICSRLCICACCACCCVHSHQCEALCVLSMLLCTCQAINLMLLGFCLQKHQTLLHFLVCLVCGWDYGKSFENPKTTGGLCIRTCIMLCAFSHQCLTLCLPGREKHMELTAVLI